MQAGSRILAVPLIALLGACSDEHNQQHFTLSGEATRAPYVEVTGTGEKRAVPDRFGVRAVARRQGENIAALTETVNAEVDTILALTRKLGIPEKRVTASELRVHPVWQHQPERRISGYRVERPVRIETRSLDTQADLLTGLAAAEIREIQPLGTGLSNRADLERAALTAAVADARAQARTLAQAAERKLGPAVRITREGTSGPRPMQLESARARPGAGSWTPGEVTLTRRVRVRFRLTP